MAKATANCTCEVCGKKFTKSAFRNNRAQADEWKVWAEENITECPDCYRGGIEQTRNHKVQEAYSLQEIIGVSEKQINYATSVRAKFLEDHDYETKKFLAAKQLVESGDPKFAENCRNLGCEPENFLEKAMEATPIYRKVSVALFESSARTILDTLLD